ncbi:hypothetical protein EVAR_80387_1 [Eumeta japonica]|uniref:Uncharacterized protein n=1 Tax=Eumeta variegata TaxID=151549 RepID=A0A4C1VGQ8_EUMVA|nr:hypothetical protein EVAR_80387_1 [Eumeta japonica]
MRDTPVAKFIIEKIASLEQPSASLAVDPRAVTIAGTHEKALHICNTRVTCARSAAHCGATFLVENGVRDAIAVRMRTDGRASILIWISTESAKWNGTNTEDSLQNRRSTDSISTAIPSPILVPAPLLVVLGPTFSSAVGSGHTSFDCESTSDRDPAPILNLDLRLALGSDPGAVVDLALNFHFEVGQAALLVGLIIGGEGNFSSSDHELTLQRQTDEGIGDLVRVTGHR